jgi:hypothetical protein
MDPANCQALFAVVAKKQRKKPPGGGFGAGLGSWLRVMYLCGTKTRWWTVWISLQG